MAKYLISFPSAAMVVPDGEWLHARCAEHAARTEAIVRMETELNARVYALCDLTPAEITTIEASTKYKYGEV